ncbi:conserved hypothetical protein [Lodderomyces elongisporus NRRL YB-4239]|uniref:Uncharacterized protein n=1 Tax=Lodderomyces elongisporus (strain ATCC 11503 / CBS 2605 / JCM 1781 / NBRC 1676 / NRRL YB-4239) TaxID=379508 RepID=A5DY89_LODEL|nr:conserved hypothetical protein [Lodderomyces elongisporus NRRL YB-4239]
MLIINFLTTALLISLAKTALVSTFNYGKEAGDVEIRNLTWNDINFLHTTDTHGWYSGHLNQKQYSANWGDFISFTTHMRNIAHANGQDLLLIDSGDRHDGNGLSDITQPNGLKSTPIFIKQSYDILTIGNHELYVLQNSEMEYETVVKHFPNNYVCSNVDFKLANGTFVPFGNKFKYFKTPVQEKRVLAFGFLFDFRRFNLGTKVTPIEREIEKQWFLDVLETYKGKVDLIIVAGHTPITKEWPEFYILHKRLREYFPETIIQYFGGHSHIRDFAVFDDKSTGIQSGRYCETVGWVSINATEEPLPVRERFSRSYIDFNVNSFQAHSRTLPSTFTTQKGDKVKKLIETTRKELKLNKLIGTVKSNYYVDYVPIDHPKSIFRLLTEKVLPTLSPASGERVIIINTGSIRYDLYKGPYTIDSQYIVTPFENKWVNLTIPKSIASRVADKLNDATYIAASRLKPPQLYLMKEVGIDFEAQNHQQQQQQQTFEVSDNIQVNPQLSKGYVTHDDFGSDGDDTPHRAVVQFKVPNVVQSIQFEDEVDRPVDLVFYDFITPNILWALKELKYQAGSSQPDDYSNIFLGELLNSYVKSLA